MFKMLDLEEVDQGHEVQLSQWRHLMAYVKIYKSRFYIFDFSQDTTYANESNRQTNTHRYRETDKDMAIGESQICLERHNIIRHFLSANGIMPTSDGQAQSNRNDLFLCGPLRVWVGGPDLLSYNA